MFSDLNIHNVTTLRHSIRSNGYRIVPLRTKAKRPFHDGWRDGVGEAEVSAQALNTGIDTRKLRAVDVDVDDKVAAPNIKNIALRVLGRTIYRVREGSTRVLLLYRAADGSPLKCRLAGKKLNLDGKLEGVEVLGDGQQALCYGIHPTGVMLDWYEDRGPHNTNILDLSAITEEQVRQFLDEVAKVLDVPPLKHGARASNGANGANGAGNGRAHEAFIEEPIENIKAALAILPNEDSVEYDGAGGAGQWETYGWFQVMQIVWAATNGNQAGYEAFEEWSAKSEKHNAKNTDRVWRGLDHSGVSRWNFGSLVTWVKRIDPDWVKPVTGDWKRDKRPKIVAVGGWLNEISDRSEQELIDQSYPVYQRGAKLVTPKPMETHTYHGKFYSTQFATITIAGLRDMLSKAIAWKKMIVSKDDDAEDGGKGKKKEVPIDPPKLYAEVILAADRQWKFSYIDGILPTPTFRPDGTLLTKPGYDDGTRMYLVDDPTIGPITIKDKPTLDDAIAAKNTLLKYIQEFSFVDFDGGDGGGEAAGTAMRGQIRGAVSRSVALSMIISLVARGILGQVPQHSVVAPTPGSGKSYLVDIASFIALGIPCPVIAVGKSEEEFNKILTSNIVAGVPLVCIDNINSELGNDLLCQMVERPIISVRPFGRNDITLQIPYRGLVVANGNNMVIRGDLIRRNLTCYLDTMEERPELKRYKLDPKDMILKDRAAPIAAALTMVRAYRCAQLPGKLPVLNSFPEWSDNVRSMLVWSGEADPCESMESVRESDPIMVRVTNLMGEIEAKFGSGVGFTLSELVERTDGFGEIHKILLMISGIRGGEINTDVLGKWFRSHKGRPFGGNVFVEAGKKSGSVVWGYCKYVERPKKRMNWGVGKRGKGEWRTLEEGELAVKDKTDSYVDEMFKNDEKEE